MAQPYTAPAVPRLVMAAIVVVGLLAIPEIVPGPEINVWANLLIYAVLFLSLGLLVRMSGLVSLAHTAIAAVGAAGIAHFTTDHGIPWLLAVLLAGLVTVPVGMIVAIPAIRLSGVFLALATLGFGLVLQNLAYQNNLMFGRLTDGISVQRPDFATGTEGFYYVLIGATIIVSIVIVAIHYGRLGRLLRALGDSPLALNTMGTSVNTLRLFVFAITSFLAGIGGALAATYFEQVSATTTPFPPSNSLQMYALVLLVPFGTPWFAIMAAAGLSIFPYYFFEKLLGVANITPYLSLLFGVSGVAVALTAEKRPTLPPSWQRFLNKFGKAKTHAVDISSVARPRPEGAGLEIAGLEVRYGGLLAVDALTLQAPFGRITGLIGPNGAGKTTTFNACSGMLKPTRGKVSYKSNEISRLTSAARGRRGIGRTFQRVELWNSLTVWENVALGHEAPIAGANVATQLASTPGQSRTIDEQVAQAIALCDIGELSGRRVNDLSTGERRLVELARVLAGPFELLLLDEPSSGLDTGETARFGAVLRRVVSERGTGILLVEHDMPLVMQVCEYIYVMDFGRLIFEGAPNEVQASEVVRAAYLGSEAPELEAFEAAGTPVGSPD
jgi:ABC-type branched-subunit amino acid transport system ATPase component/ABC-type branched-subunit amino acid transport system permease subunit